MLFTSGKYPSVQRGSSSSTTTTTSPSSSTSSTVGLLVLQARLAVVDEQIKEKFFGSQSSVKHSLSTEASAPRCEVYETSATDFFSLMSLLKCKTVGLCL